MHVSDLPCYGAILLTERSEVSVAGPIGILSVCLSVCTAFSATVFIRFSPNLVYMFLVVLDSDVYT